jgi:hypothetical protein
MKFELMKAYGYPAGAPLSEEGLVELAEVTFASDSPTLRRIAAFLMKQADEMDALLDQFDHAHAQDEDRPWPDEWPDIIVARGARH